MRRYQVRNLTRQSLLADEVRVADTFRARFIGLMGTRTLPFGHGLLIEPCTSIHTFFMKLTIDALFLDERREVVAVYHALAPWRLSRFHPGARSVLELPAGTALGSKTEVGDRLEIG